MPNKISLSKLNTALDTSINLTNIPHREGKCNTTITSKSKKARKKERRYSNPDVQAPLIPRENKNSSGRRRSDVHSSGGLSMTGGNHPRLESGLVPVPKLVETGSDPARLLRLLDYYVESATGDDRTGKSQLADIAFDLFVKGVDVADRDNVLLELSRELNLLAERALDNDMLARDMLLGLSYHQDSRIQALALSHLPTLYARRPEEIDEAVIDLMRWQDPRVVRDQDAVVAATGKGRREIGAQIRAMRKGLEDTGEQKGALDAVLDRLLRAVTEMGATELEQCREGRAALLAHRGHPGVDKLIARFDKHIQRLVFLRHECKRTTVTAPATLHLIAMRGLRRLGPEHELLSAPESGNIANVVNKSTSPTDLNRITDDAAPVPPEELDLLQTPEESRDVPVRYAGCVVLEDEFEIGDDHRLARLSTEHFARPHVPTICDVKVRDRFYTLVLIGDDACILNTRPTQMSDLDQNVDRLACWLGNRIYPDEKGKEGPQFVYKNITAVNYKAPHLYDQLWKDDVVCLTQRRTLTEGRNAAVLTFIETGKETFAIPHESQLQVRREPQQKLVNSDGMFGQYLTEYLSSRKNDASPVREQVLGFLRAYDNKGNKGREEWNTIVRLQMQARALERVTNLDSQSREKLLQNNQRG